MDDRELAQNFAEIKMMLTEILNLISEVDEGESEEVEARNKRDEE